MKRWIGIILIITGILIISWALYTNYDVKNKQKKMMQEFESVLKSVDAGGAEDYTQQDGDSLAEGSPAFEVPDANEEAAQAKDTSKVDETSKKEEAPKIDRVPDGALGIMTIPKIGLKVAVVEGIETKSLKYAVGHFEDTPGFGEKGNCAIAGHRSYTYNQFFNRLDEVENGDEIIVKTPKGEYKYRVYEKIIVQPTDSWVLDNTEDATVTLVTCHPQRSSEYRLVVKGKLE